jgi:hypothetical protein
MTLRRQSFSASGLEVGLGSIGSIALAQLFCWIAAIPLPKALALNASIYLASFLVRLGLTGQFFARAAARPGHPL